MSASYQMYLTPDLAQAFEHAPKIAEYLKDDFISTEHLFISLIDSCPEVRELLSRFRIFKDQTLRTLEEMRTDTNLDMTSSKKFRLLTKFTRNLTALAREDKLDPVIGRDVEIMRLMQILSRRTKNNPILIGEAGTGKTAVVEGLANRIAKVIYQNH